MQSHLCNFITAILLFSVIAGCSGSSGTNSTTGATITVAGVTSTLGAVSISKTALQFNESTTASATFTKADGTPASGISVLFTTTTGSLNPANGVVTTGSDGTATIQLTTGSTSGQGQLTASATVDNKQVSKTSLFSVSLPSLKLSAISLGLSSLSYGGSTAVSLTVLDANGATFTGQEVDVTFTSTLAASGQATIPASVRTVNGIATVTYQATTGTGSDTITAAISGVSKTASITINPLSATAITFVSASPVNIGLKGMGGAGIQETSKVTFKVIDTANQPKGNQQIDFALNTSVGGLSLSSASGSTGSDGTVSTIVQSGVIATSVRVTATIRGSNPVIATQSDQLVVSTGVPAQDGFSISIETLNPEAWNTDGVVDKVTVRLSDHFHNPVPDGTAVYFTTSGGSIQPSCITFGGACSVDWTSQNPRPVNGRARILAYAVGEESFIDLNGNGLADTGEFTDDSEAFRNDDESRLPLFTGPETRQSNETFIDFNSDGTFNTPDGIYNGILQGAAYAGAPKSKHVFSNSTIVMASSSALVANSCSSPIPVVLGGSKSCNLTINDVNGNTMPAGTKVEFALSSIRAGLTLTSDTYTFPNTSANFGATLNITIADGGVAPTLVGRGVLKVTVTSPKGLVTRYNYDVN